MKDVDRGLEGDAYRKINKEYKARTSKAESEGLRLNRKCVVIEMNNKCKRKDIKIRV